MFSVCQQWLGEVAFMYNTTFTVASPFTVCEFTAQSDCRTIPNVTEYYVSSIMCCYFSFSHRKANSYTYTLDNGVYTARCICA